MRLYENRKKVRKAWEDNGLSVDRFSLINEDHDGEVAMDLGGGVDIHIQIDCFGYLNVCSAGADYVDYLLETHNIDDAIAFVKDYKKELEEKK